MRALITGASSGLGAALAAQLAAPGVSLGLFGRDLARLEAVAASARSAGAKAEVFALDVRDVDALGEAAVRFDEAGPVDLVVAAAGVSAGVPPGAAGEGLPSVTQQVGVNLLGAAATVEPLAPRMAARGRGAIVLVSSIAGLRGLPYSPGYSASKAGVRAYGEALRALLAPRGVHVLVATPGFFTSPMTDRWRGSTPWLWSDRRTAQALLQAVRSRRPRWGFPWPLMLGLRLADLGPPWLTDRILRSFHFHIDPPAP